MTSRYVTIFVRCFVAAVTAAGVGVSVYIEPKMWFVMVPVIPVAAYFIFLDQIGRFIFPPEPPYQDLER